MIVLLLALSMASCYSVRITNQDSVPESDANTSEGFYRNLKVHQVDTVIRQKSFEQFTLIEKTCGDCGFYSIEYKSTLGGILLNTITFGTSRSVRIKYVCATN